MRLTKLLLAWLATATLLISCSPGNIPVNDNIIVKSQLLQFPTASYENVVYMNGRLVVFGYGPETLPSSTPSFAYEGDPTLSPFNLPNDATCIRYTRYYVRGGVLPDGRLGLLKDCGGQSLRSVGSVFAYNWQTGELEKLVQGPLPEVFSLRSYTWNPQMTRGIQVMGDALYSTIYWITPESALPMDVEVEDQGLTWNLRDFYDGKQRVGSADFPAWSPDGNTIAFFATTYGLQEEPLPKLNVKSELYLMNISDMKPKQILQGIANASRLRWSPDSKRLAFSGCIGFPLECGLWLYSLDTKSLALVDHGDFADITWITNQELAAIKNIEVTYANNQIWEYSFQQSSQP